MSLLQNSNYLRNLSAPLSQSFFFIVVCLKMFSVRVCSSYSLHSLGIYICYKVESVGIDVCPQACADRLDLKQEVNECNNSKMPVSEIVAAIML